METTVQNDAFAATEPPWDRSAMDVIQHIGDLVDASGDAAEPAGARLAIRHCERLRESSALTAKESTLLDYFEANAWNHLSPSPEAGSADAWKWGQPAFENEIRLLRRAQRSQGFSSLEPIRQSQIYTNIANGLDTLGRFVEAIEFYRRAIDLAPDHGMARGNLGICLATYGVMLSGQPHQAGRCPLSAFLVRALTHLVAAQNSPLHPYDAHAFAVMRSRVQGLLQSIGQVEGITLGNEVRYTTQKEARYRQWCLTECLFLHPLNDLDVFDAGAADILHIPPVVDDTAFMLSLFNQVKQEYATARYLLYEGIENKKAHFADREVMLTNVLDYSAHSICLEQVRIAFRMAYSVFDKIAFLLNHYLQLGIKPWKVNFRTLWHEKEDTKVDLKPFFRDRQNRPLRGLFGLSRDFCAVDGDGDALDPEAQELVAIRNHLEHKHLIVHDESWVTGGRGPGGETPDGKSFSIDRPEFETRALRILKLARSSLIYLVHAVPIEERLRAAARPTEALIIPLAFPPIDDRSKC
jgi:tetratricopeptide (TPR) repeat protein